MEKMREEFEAWVITRNVCIKYGAKLRTCPDGSYYDYRINDRWLAWKASRSALCVNLSDIEFSKDRHGEGGLILTDSIKSELEYLGVDYE